MLSWCLEGCPTLWSSPPWNVVLATSIDETWIGQFHGGDGCSHWLLVKMAGRNVPCPEPIRDLIQWRPTVIFNLIQSASSCALVVCPSSAHKYLFITPSLTFLWQSSRQCRLSHPYSRWVRISIYVMSTTLITTPHWWPSTRELSPLLELASNGICLWVEPPKPGCGLGGVWCNWLHFCNAFKSCAICT